MPHHVLVIDDDPALRDLVAAQLEARGTRVTAVGTAAEALAIVGTDTPIGAVVTDESMEGGMSGVELCRHIHALRPALPVILMTAYGSVGIAVAAMRAGVYDFVTKPFDEQQLAAVVERALAKSALRRELVQLRDTAARDDRTIVGRSAVMERLRELVSRVAASDATVLVTGESGTGKELVARALHDQSAHSAGPFVAINCAAMPENLLESELFGHSRGAFTDAKTSRPGLFVRATGGTIFLDEIGEMPAGMQAKLLRAVQERRVRPLGSDSEVPFDARIITATHRDLQQEVEAGRFREDLYYRVNVVCVKVPPLRQRGSDILLLAQRFLADSTEHSPRKPKGFSTAVADRLLSYSWPGNVRQLQNTIERAVAVSLGDELTLDDLPNEVLHEETPQVDVAVDQMVTMAEVERRYIRKLLVALNGNKTAVAEALGFDRRTLYRKLERMEQEQQEQGK